jgi:predicted nucleic acid-binding protein
VEPSVLGVVLDSSIVITAERKGLSVPLLIEAILSAFGDIELSLSPITVAELVHGIYRTRTATVSRRRRAYIEELVNLVPLHPITLRTAYLVGQIEGEEAAKGNVLPSNDLLIAAAAIEQGYAVLTENLRHFEKIPGINVMSLSSTGNGRESTL